MFVGVCLIFREVELATFTGTANHDRIDSRTGTIQGFTGGTLGDLNDAAIDTIYGGAGNDFVYAGPGTESVYGEGGDDTLDAGPNPGFGAYYSYLYGGAGNDTLSSVESGYVYMFGGAGADTLHFRSGFGEGEGGAGADILIGSGDYIAVDLSYRGSPAGVEVDLGKNTADGGDATGDIISNFRSVFGSAHGDTLIGSSEENALTGLAGNDLLRGIGGDDALIGDAGKDKLFGGSGDDRLDGGKDGDLLDGGPGFDAAVYESSTAGVSASLVGGKNSGDAKGDRFKGIEALDGSAYNDRLTGNNRVNLIEGNNGNDKIRGGGGNDELSGSRGDDRVDGGAGNDVLSAQSDYDFQTGYGQDYYIGGKGFDTVRYGFFDDITINLAKGRGTGGAAQGDRFSSIEKIVAYQGDANLTGSKRSEVLDVGDGTNVVNAGGGNDVIKVGDGTDTVDGGKGSDTIGFASIYGDGAIQIDLISGHVAGHPDVASDTYGNIENLVFSYFGDAATLLGTNKGNRFESGSGDDMLNGRGGKDWLDGGSGNDVLIGGKGADRFVFSVNFSTATADIIEDFQNIDRILLVGDVFDAIGPKLTKGEFVYGATAKNAKDRVIFDKATGKLYYDADGTGSEVPDLIATINGPGNVTFDNLILI